MKKWFFSALAYLIVVVGIYYAYTITADTPDEHVEHSDAGQH